MLHIESSVGQAVCEDLTRRGHVLNIEPPFFVTMGGAGITRINSYGVREGGADPRRESYALAY